MKHLLSATIPYSPIEDLFRYFVIALGAGSVAGHMIMRAVKYRDVHWTMKRVVMTWALLLAGLLGALQEYQQLGHRMLWWRLPGLMVITVLIAVGVYTPDKPEDRDWRLQDDLHSDQENASQRRFS